MMASAPADASSSALPMPQVTPMAASRCVCADDVEGAVADHHGSGGVDRLKRGADGRGLVFGVGGQVGSGDDLEEAAQGEGFEQWFGERQGLGGRNGTPSRSKRTAPWGWRCIGFILPEHRAGRALPLRDQLLVLTAADAGHCGTGEGCETAPLGDGAAGLRSSTMVRRRGKRASDRDAVRLLDAAPWADPKG